MGYSVIQYSKELKFTMNHQARQQTATLNQNKTNFFASSLELVVK